VPDGGKKTCTVTLSGGKFDRRDGGTFAMLVDDQNRVPVDSEDDRRANMGRITELSQRHEAVLTVTEFPINGHTEGFGAFPADLFDTVDNRPNGWQAEWAVVRIQFQQKIDRFPVENHVDRCSSHCDNDRPADSHILSVDQARN